MVTLSNKCRKEPLTICATVWTEMGFKPSKLESVGCSGSLHLYLSNPWSISPMPAGVTERVGSAEAFSSSVSWKTLKPEKSSRPHESELCVSHFRFRDCWLTNLGGAALWQRLWAGPGLPGLGPQVTESKLPGSSRSCRTSSSKVRARRPDGDRSPCTLR